MKKTTKWLTLSSALLLSSIVSVQAVHADHISATTATVKTIETTSLNQARTTAKLQASLSNGTPLLTLSDLSVTDTQAVSVTIFTQANQSDAVVYEARKNPNGSYTVALNRGLHTTATDAFYAQVTLNRANQVVDSLSQYSFTWSSNAAQPATTTSVTTTQKTTQTKPSTTVKTTTTTTKVTQPTQTSKSSTTTISSNSTNTKPVTTAPRVKQPKDTTTSVTTNTSNTLITKPDTNGKAVFSNQSDQTSGTLHVIKEEPTKTIEIIVANPNTTEGVQEVRLSVWSATNGKDDIKWYTAKKQVDNTYKAIVALSDHKLDIGEYYINLYYLDRKKKLVEVGTTTTTISKPATDPTGNVSIVQTNKTTGAFDVTISDIYAPKGLKEVVVPIWSDQGGQDDIRWYSAQKQTNGTYKVAVNPANHKNNSGLYHVHLYYRQNDGKLKGVLGTKTTVTMETPKQSLGKISVINQNNEKGTFDVVISGVNPGYAVKEILVPTWSDKNGQDDIRWYAAKKDSRGDYRISVSKSNHKGDTGLYHIHYYLRDSAGKLHGAGGTKTTLTQSTQTRPTGDLTIEKHSAGFDVLVSNVSAPSGVKSVSVPVWSDAGGQDDIRWYTATKQSNGTYRASVKLSDHKNTPGLYHAHLYYRLNDGQFVGVGGTTTQATLPATSVFKATETLSKVIFIDPGHGGKDPGAVYGGVREKDLALSVSQLLKSKLEGNGYQVIMSRNGDQHVDFVTERSRLANNSNADIFVSIHFNATGAGTTTASGIETYYYQSYAQYPSKINQAKHNDPKRLADSASLASKVQSSLVQQTGAVNRGVKRNTFAVLRETAKPAILVELGYMDNPTELAKIKRKDYHEKLANGLAQGILSWYKGK